MKTKLQAKIQQPLARSEEPSQPRPDSSTMSISIFNRTVGALSGIQWAPSPEPNNSPSKKSTCEAKATQSPNTAMIMRSDVSSLLSPSPLPMHYFTLETHLINGYLFRVDAAPNRRMRNHSSLVKPRRTKKERANHSATNSWANCYMIEKQNSQNATQQQYHAKTLSDQM